MQVTLRAQLVDLDTQRVLGSQLFEISEAAPSEDAYGGVQAANRAVARLLEELVAFCIGQAG
jgi:cholesterol transport system auxiliary component